MEHFKEAIVDIAQSLLSNPWILLKIWIESYAMILMDTTEETMINNSVKFREHFLEAMRDKTMDKVEGTSGIKYLEEMELNERMLKELWKNCLGVDLEDDSFTMLFPFPIMRKMLDYLKNYKDDRTMEIVLSSSDMKKKDLTIYTSSTTVPDPTEPANVQSYKDLESCLEPNKQYGPVNSLDNTLKISQVKKYIL